MTGFNSKRDAAADKLQEPEGERAWFTISELNAWADKKLTENPHWATPEKEALAQPAQEPVAWTTMPELEDWCFVSGNKDPNGKLDGKWFPLYTTPPQREPLTDADYVNACISYRHDFGLMTQEQRDKLIFQAREWARAFGMNEAAHGIKENT